MFSLRFWNTDYNIHVRYPEALRTTIKYKKPITYANPPSLSVRASGIWKFYDSKSVSFKVFFKKEENPDIKIMMQLRKNVWIDLFSVNYNLFLFRVELYKHTSILQSFLPFTWGCWLISKFLDIYLIKKPLIALEWNIHVHIFY